LAQIEVTTNSYYGTSNNPHIHPTRKLLSPPALRGWGNRGAYGPMGPALCGILQANFGE